MKLSALLPLLLLQAAVLASTPFSLYVDPLTVPYGNVSVITGDFFQHEVEVATRSHEPISSHRVHASSDEEGHHTGIWRYSRDHITAYTEQGKGTRLVLFSQEGGVIQFKETSEGSRSFEPILSAGVCNTYSSNLSGQTNLRNYRLEYLENGHLIKLIKGNGEQRFFRNKTPPENLNDYVKKEYIWRIERVIRPSGNHILWTNNPLVGRARRLRYPCIESKMRLMDPTETVCFGWIQIEHNFHEQGGVQETLVSTDDRQKVTRRYLEVEHRYREGGHRRKEKYVTLQKTSQPDGPTHKYSYTKFTGLKPKMLTSVRINDSLSAIDYHSYLVNVSESLVWWRGGRIEKLEKVDSPRAGRVLLERKAIKDPNKLQPIILYDYKLTKRGHETNRTVVCNCIGGHSLFYYDSEQRLTSVVRFEDGTPYSHLHQEWGAGPNEGNLIRRVEEDGFRNLVREKRYNYDPAGNVKTLIFCGMLTGTGQDYELHSTQYRYSSDGFNLPIYESDGRSTIEMTYKPGTNLCTRKLIKSKHRIKERTFTQYNDWAVKIEETWDNGSSPDPDSLAGVTQRLITRYSCYEKEPLAGLTKEIQKLYWDHNTGEEVQLSKRLLQYGKDRLVCQEDHYDANDSLRYTTHTRYNRQGLPVQTINALGEETVYEYTPARRLARMQELGSGRHTTYSYDLLGNLTESSIHSEGTEHLIHRQFHDRLGNVRKKIDSQGNQSFFRYDSHGRCVRKAEPPIRTSGNASEWRVTHYVYDALDRIVAETSPLGHTTQIEYNARDQVTAKHHPDGRTERWEYTLDGHLCCYFPGDGSVQEYECDYKGRETKRCVFDLDENLLSVASTSYEGNQISSQTDENGETTSYTFDGAGRLIEKRRGDSRVEHTYDPLGRQSAKLEWVGGDARVTRWEYDLLDRVTVEQQEDLNGQVGSRKEVYYDRAGRVVEERLYHQPSEAAITLTTYDALDRPLAVTNPLGHLTTYRYNDQFLLKDEKISNAVETQRELTPPSTSYLRPVGIYHFKWEQLFGTQTIEQSPNGVETHSTAGPSGQELLVEKYDKEGNLLSKTSYLYDKGGHCIEEAHHTVLNGLSGEPFTVERTYGPADQLLSLTEGGERTTLYSYNEIGQLAETHLPDGITLTHTYDCVSRLKTYSGPDFHWEYNYDPVGNLLSIHSGNGQTKRSYDHNGRITSESLATGYTLYFTYDPLGRPIRLVLPDQSAVSYNYDALHLRQVTRLDPHGSPRYEHTYLEYDCLGLPTRERLATGTVSQTTRDLLGRQTTFLSDHFEEKISNYDSVGNVLQRNDPNGSYSYSYDYLNQLTSGDSQVYRYDSLGNCHHTAEGPRTFDHLNQLTATPNETLHYDTYGRLIKRDGPEPVGYSYDSLGRLIHMEVGDQSLSFTYDPFGRRLTKTSSKASGPEHYLYWADREIGATRAGDITQLRTLGLGQGAEIGASIGIELGDKLCVPIHDYRGCLVRLLDLSGQLLQSYTYTAFGSARSTTPLFCPWQFLSKRLDPEMGLTCFGHRYYDPCLMRWLTPDPLGYSEGPNLYAYCLNNPLSFIDLWGLAIDPLGILSPREERSLARSRSLDSVETAAIYEAAYRASCRAELRRTVTFVARPTMRAFHAIVPFDHTTGDVAYREADLFRDHFLPSIEGPDMSYRSPAQQVAATVGGLDGQSWANCQVEGAMMAVGSAIGQIGRLSRAIRPVTQGIRSTSLARQGNQLNRFNQAARNLSPAGKNNIRALRGWARSRGHQKLPNPTGRPEQWGTFTPDGTFSRTLHIKAEGSLRPGLSPRSHVPRFDARLSPGEYINPFTNEVGNSSIGTHLPLEANYYGK